jgi:hypothetical protein
MSARGRLGGAKRSKEKGTEEKREQRGDVDDG